MTLALRQVTPPASEPVTLTEAKTHLRQDVSAEDALIETLIQVAREHAESVTGRAFITQTWEYAIDDFPPFYWRNHRSHIHDQHAIRLPKTPVQTVDAVNYLAPDGSDQTVDPSVYRVDSVSDPTRVTEADGSHWPTTNHVTNAVRVEFTAGYGDNAEDVPAAIRQAILLMIGHWYDHRQAVMEDNVAETPMAAKSLLAPYKFWWWQ